MIDDILYLIFKFQLLAQLRPRQQRQDRSPVLVNRTAITKVLTLALNFIPA